MGNGSQPLLLGGVYMPCQDTRQQDAVLEQLCTTLTTHATTLAIISGDWNMDIADKHMATFIASNNLTKIIIVDANGDIKIDPITHMCEGPGTHFELDHILVRLPPNARLLNSTTKAIAHGGLSDHTPLLTSLTIENYGYHPAPEPHVAEAEPRIVTHLSVRNAWLISRDV
jgi:endonuclease/exonuclease/phosphatase family metal-dependent hydrolase